MSPAERKLLEAVADALIGWEGGAYEGVAYINARVREPVQRALDELREEARRSPEGGRA